MDILTLIRTFSNGEKFVKRQQTRTDKGTLYTYDMKRPDRKLRKKSFSFLAPRDIRQDVRYVNFFIEDSRENYLAARILNEKFLSDAINS